MGSGSAYNYIAMKEAIADSGLRRKLKLVILKLV
jgi:3-oxoacyl-(acyl-carrier-protein) synthase